ncbi:M16 family metallopeptidase [Paramicrobacterium agarici]|uniref:Putative Zn-dependent peptidase n=1 Tax=Paramicrobacterium agarici TaxID=630514 RepID=A0A2A9DYM5_9MICO|nr:pitrilysin family protein [Microbacterium agarici]PFG31030.1 putative Zn-dependent peptidase [Microbacterium agarici]
MNSAVPLPLDLPELDFEAAGGTRIRRSILPGGVRVLSEAVPGARSATIGFWVAVGSRDEYHATATPSGHGSTHFLEHLLFKGTPTRSALDIAVAFDSVGGDSNAMTAKEFTCYYAKVRDSDVPMAIGVLTDMVTSSVIDGGEFETERGVILEELSHAADDPGDVAGNALFEAVLGEHPLGRPVGGTSETIEQATREGVWDHYLQHYRPNELVISVAGAVDHEELLTLVTRSLDVAGWERDVDAKPVSRRADTPARLADTRSLTTIPRPIEQVHLMLGMPGLIATDPDRVTLSMLNAVLGGGMSSRLFTEIRERRGLAYSVYSFAGSHSDAGMQGMYAACAPRNAAQVADLMRAELQKLADTPVSDDELARAYGQLSGRAALGLEDSDVRMSLLGRAEITLGEYLDLDENLRRLARVTATDIADMAARLVAQPQSLVAVGAVDDDLFANVDTRKE